MSSEVLFTITKDQLETGLRGYPCGYCTTSYVDPLKGLFYGGVAVSSLSKATPEEVLYLLYHGKRARGHELAGFYKEISSRSFIKKETMEAIQTLPRSAHPMKLLAMSLLLLGVFEGEGNYKEDCMNLIGKIPVVVATLINHHAGWKSAATSRPELGYMQNFCHMLSVPAKETMPKLAEVFSLFNILHFDHGGGNLSAFVGKAVASGLEDLYGSICSAMCALAGPRHGKANQDCLEFVKSMISEVGENASAEDVENAIRLRLQEGKLVFGFGHAVLRVEDPRATVQYDYVQKHFSSDPLVKMALLLREAGTKVLGENPKISNPYPNVDAISGALLSAAGFAYPQYYTVLFGLARSVGIAIQIVYERLYAREGKGTPIVRPKYLYKAQ